MNLAISLTPANTSGTGGDMGDDPFPGTSELNISSNSSIQDTRKPWHLWFRAMSWYVTNQKHGDDKVCRTGHTGALLRLRSKTSGVVGALTTFDPDSTKTTDRGRVRSG